MSIFDQMSDYGRENPVAPAGSVAAPGSDSPGGGLDLSFFISLGASLGSLVDGMSADRDRRAAQEPPGDEQIFGSGTVPTSGTLIMDLGSVPVGRVWQVRRVVIGGALITATPTGSAWLYRQGAPPNDLATPNMVDSWPSFSTGAQGSTYGTHQLFLQGTEHLFVVITGGVSGNRWVASAQVEDWAETTFKSTFTE